MVGYAEAIVKYYKIEELRAHVWIAHQRYPDQGPRLASRRRASVCGHRTGAGAQRRLRQLPFGDASTCAQRNIYPAVPHRHRSVGAVVRPAGTALYDYPLEYIIEALAPDHGTGLRPAAAGEAADLPARSRPPTSTARPTAPGSSSSPATWPGQKQFQLMGITDTAMLRPQVFAFCDGEVQMGLICSEKQAIDATLPSLAEGGPADLSRGGHLLERPRRQSHRRRGVPADGFATSRRLQCGRRCRGCHWLCQCFWRLRERHWQSQWHPRVAQRPRPLRVARDRQVRQGRCHALGPIALQPLAAADRPGDRPKYSSRSA